MPLFKNSQNPHLNQEITGTTNNQTPTVEMNLGAEEVTKTDSPISKKVTLDALLKGDKTDRLIVESGEGNQEQTTFSAEEHRFQDVKYKIYTFIVVCILIITYTPFENALQTTLSKRRDVKTIETTINQRIQDQHDYAQITDYIAIIEENKANLIQCFNESIGCEQIPEDLMTNKETIRQYIQIGDLDREKMDIDEAKILRSINEFMIKSAYSSPEQIIYNGTVTNIVIGDKAEMNNNIIKVPVDLTITFNDQKNLINFLNNLEKKVFYDQIDGLNHSVLYQIQEINYDIANYNQSQDVQIKLNAYAYNQ